MTHEEFLLGLGRKAAQKLVEPFLAAGSVNCYRIMDRLPVAKMLMVQGETHEAFRTRWFQLVDYALGVAAEDGPVAFTLKPMDNEAASLIKGTFGEDVLKALRWAR